MASMNYFDSDMSKSTNTIVYFDGKTVIYIYVCRQCRTQFMLPNSSRWWLVNMWFYDSKVNLIDGAPVAIILCLQILIEHDIFINIGYFDYFQGI